MEYLLGIILALIGGLFYFKGKADKSGADARIAETKGRDRELADQQAFVEQAIQDLDNGIKKMNEERNSEENKYKSKTLKERADESKNRYKK